MVSVIVVVAEAISSTVMDVTSVVVAVAVSSAVVVVIAVGVKKAVASISPVVADVEAPVMAKEKRDIWSMIVVATTT